MASNNINISGSGGYNYAYTKPMEAEQQQKKIDTSVAGGAVGASNATVATLAKQGEAESVEKPQEIDGNSEVKSLYDLQQEEIKRREEERKKRTEEERKAEEERRKRAEEERRSEYLKELSDKLNKRMSSFSEHIKFGINDRADSIVVSIVEQNNEKKLKELSQEEADKLFRRLDYVLGVLFDNKG